MLKIIVAYSTVVLAAALWTGATNSGGYFFTDMTGFFPPHYGYSMYAVSILPLLAPWPWLRWLAVLALILSRNRASWLGLLAGWVVAGGRRRIALGLILTVLSAFGGIVLKPHGVKNDTVRVHIWKAAVRRAWRQPHGVGRNGFYIGVDGRATGKAHSDVLQILVEDGWVICAIAVLGVFGALYVMPAGPIKAALVCLAAQSVIDNRLHHPACLALYLALWVARVYGLDYGHRGQKAKQ